MRYLQALEQKGLKKEDLAKTIQKRISELESRQKKVEDNADDYDKDELDEILEKIKEYDRIVADAIMKFDPEIYQKRRDVFERNKKRARGIEVEVETETEEEDDDEEEQEQPQVQVVKQVQPVQEQPKQQPKQSISEKLDDLEQKVKTQPEKFKVEEEVDEDEEEVEEENDAEEVEVEEIENYKNKGTIKPKKMSTSIILMGVGAFLLTWGAVNFFRERR